MSENTTPLMKQYYKIKREHPDSILLFRIGDFYETFEEDAKIASKVLGITLTKRSNGAAGDVPLAGFPYHAIDAYLPKLVKAGYRVAICEQMENPKFAKGIVKREVIEVISPGVAFSDKILDHKKNNYIASLFFDGSSVGIGFGDISTGEFFCYEQPIEKIHEQIENIKPSEILCQKKDRDAIQKILEKIGHSARISKIDDWIWDYAYANEILTKHFQTANLKGFGIEDLKKGIIACGALLSYLKETQKSAVEHWTSITRYNPTEFMYLDAATKRNLELIFTIREGTSDGALFSVIDKTETPMGARLLKNWFFSPLLKIEQIQKRLNLVEIFVINKDVRKKIKEILSSIADLERLISRVCAGKTTPRELQNLKNSLMQIPFIKNEINKINNEDLQKLNEKLNPLKSLIDKINAAIIENPPSNFSEGGFIKEGYMPELDELRNLSTNAKEWIAAFQKKERERTGIGSLKVNFNKVFGYYIEITNAHKDKIPDNYQRRQTLANAERFITPELKEYEDKILQAEEKIIELELAIFNQIKSEIASETKQIQTNAKIIAIIDCLTSLAECADEYNYTKPEINEGNEIEIIEGRHPVVERILKAGETFQPNNVYLSSELNQIIILTGPNMAGKSVYLRMVGLIVLLAQIGSFVPAKKAKIGIVDRIFTRVGASDNISAGESTFLVEMQEAANILTNASPKSLILFDEVGRGTSTFDGISIAWAIVEYLHENPQKAAKTIFATHYHELTEMAQIYQKISNYKMDVLEIGNDIVFLHKVAPGSSDHSFGIHVAKMAGLPEVVTKRANDILASLESKEITPLEIKKAKIAKRKGLEGQFTLFEFTDDEIRNELRKIDINTLTPIEAINKLSELKTKVEKNT